MDVPKRIHVNLGNEPRTNVREAVPAGYYDSEEYESEGSEYDDDYAPKIQVDQTARIMSPPHKLTLHEISDEERHRIVRDTSLNYGTTLGANLDETTYKTPNDSVLRNMSSFQSGDPVSLAKQVSHLRNRVKMIEGELQTHQNRQFFLFSIISVYIFYKGVKWLGR